MKKTCLFVFLTFVLFTSHKLMAMVGPEQLIPGQTPESSSEGGTPWWAEDQTQSVSADDPDPLEPINRVIFGFNQVVDGILLKPIAILYHDTLPDMARTGVTNFMENLFAPVTFGNNLLQAEAEDAARTFFRFVINSTFGMLGLIDAAKEMGVPAKPATLNQTFAKWGVETGPYLVLPLLGPSSFRGTYGTIGEWFMNPWTYMVQNKHRRYNHHGQQRTLLYMLYGLDIVNRRAKLIAALNDLEKSSLDLYATIRSIYFQKQKEMEQSLKSKKEESRETDSTFRKQQAELGGATMFN